MASPRDPELKGLARSLDDLFRRSGSSSRTAAGSGPGAVPEVDDPLAAARELDDRVDEFLTRRGRERDAVTRPIRELAAALVRMERIEPVADAVIRLAMVPAGQQADEGVTGLTRALATPRVAQRLAARLGAVRDGSRRGMLLRTLSTLGPSMAEAAGDALRRTESRSARRALTDLLVALGRDAAGVLSEMTRDERWYVVRNAVLILGEGGGDWAVEYLEEALEHPDERVRRETLMALARIGGRHAGRRVTPLLGDPDERVREAAALTVGSLAERAAVEPLVRLVERGDTDAVVVAALRALGRIGDPRATDILERRATGTLLSRATPEVRVAAYRALAALGTPEARAAVRAGLRDREAEVREVAEELVRSLGRENAARRQETDERGGTNEA